jgi:hypothetical protein
MATYLILVDTNNKSWQIGVAPSGELLVSEIILRVTDANAILQAKFINGTVLNAGA